MEGICSDMAVTRLMRGGFIMVIGTAEEIIGIVQQKRLIYVKHQEKSPISVRLAKNWCIVYRPVNVKIPGLHFLAWVASRPAPSEWGPSRHRRI
jgi:formylmethanofuran dehydrogenase subunit C